jgi:spore coat polysaccharide biosynthesis protein SpsF (cytidylyltransferase family)
VKVVAIVQARMGSSRLPGKVLADIAGHPMLWHVVTRTRQAKLVDRIVVATSTRQADDAVAEFCVAHGIDSYRGNETDVLDRYYQAARAHGADIIVRITADCPLIDPVVIDLAIARLVAPCTNVDYVSTDLPQPTYPRGLDVEVMAAAALERAWEEDHDSVSREHVTPYIYRHPTLFRLGGVPNPVDHSHHRWTVDTTDDLELVRQVFSAFERDDFTWMEVFELLVDRPELIALNQHVQQNVVR